MSGRDAVVMELAGAWESHGAAPSPLTWERAMLALSAALEVVRAPAPGK